MKYRAFKFHNDESLLAALKELDELGNTKQIAYNLVSDILIVPTWMTTNGAMDSIVAEAKEIEVALGRPPSSKLG